MQQFLFALVVGLGAGGMFAILGAGLVVGFKGSGVINFAHGAIAMYTAYTWSELRLNGDIQLPWFDILPTETLNLPVTIHVADAPVNGVMAFTIAMLMAAFLGLLCHLLVFRPLRHATALGKVVGSIGIMLYLQQVAVLNFGTTNRTEQGILPTGSFKNFLWLDAQLGQDRLIVAGVAVVVGIVFTFIYRATRFGLATRASEENEKGAVLIGLSPQFVAGLNWVISALLAGLAGLLFVGIATLTPVNYTLFIIPALVAALLGNLQSVGLAVAAGLALGAIQSGVTDLSTRAFWPDWIPRDAVAALIPFLAVVIYLFVRGDKLPVRGSIGPVKQARVPSMDRPLQGPIITFVLGCIAMYIFTGSWMVALTTSIVFAVFMLSLVVIVGFVGQISLAQLSIAGIAAYAMIRFASDGTRASQFQEVVVDGPGFPAPLSMLLGVLIAVAIGMLIGLPALRIRGVQLAVVTLTAAVAIEAFIFRNETIVGPGAVTNNPVPRPSFFGLDVGVVDTETNTPDRWQFSLFALVWLVVLMFIVNNLRRSTTGQRFLAVRANERAAAATGINVARTKLLGFAISSAIAGIAGVLLAYKFTSVKYDNFELFVGLGLLAFAFLGGITVSSGAVAGGLLVGGGLVATRLNGWFDGVSEYIVAVGAIGLILTAIFNPEGIVLGNVDLAKHLAAKFRRRREPPPGQVPAEVADSKAQAGT